MFTKGIVRASLLLRQILGFISANFLIKLVIKYNHGFPSPQNKKKKKRTPKMPVIFIVDSNKNVLSKENETKKMFILFTEIMTFPNGQIQCAKI